MLAHIQYNALLNLFIAHSAVHDVLAGLPYSIALGDPVPHNAQQVERCRRGEKRIHRSEQVVLGSNDEGPPRPDGGGREQRQVLRAAHLLHGAARVREPRDDEAPLERGRPEVHGARARLAAPEPAERKGNAGHNECVCV